MCRRGPRLFLSLAKPIEELNGKRAEMATLQCTLALVEFGDDAIGIVLEVFVSLTGIHQGRGGEVEPAGAVTAKFAIGSFPSSKWLCGCAEEGMPAWIRKICKRQ